jgi:predicted nuclease with TOPRIM domain
MKKPELHDAIAKAAGKWFNVLYSPELVVDEESYEKHVSWQVGIDHTQSVVYGEEKDKPKWEDVKKAMDELEAEYALFEFQRKRKPEYPKIEDQLDLLYHKGVDGWKEEIQKVKDKYPKPVVEEPKVEEPKEVPSE